MSPSDGLNHLIGETPRFQDIINRLPTIAQSNATVVVAGETGTGKELIARALHYLGPRAVHPFVPVNCGALPDSLLEDELFGHERGAFTDAKGRRVGLLSQAQHGTLFLDEVDSLTARAQVALLRVLQEGTYRMLGGDREFLANVRFVAATNTSLAALVCAGRFRSDLYYRLNVLGIDLPPLRERQDDIMPLAQHFLIRHRQGPSPSGFAVDAERALRSHAWPGNVRELENAVQRALALTKSAAISVDELGLSLVLPPQQSAATPLRRLPVAVGDGHRPDDSIQQDDLAPFSEAKRAVVDAFECEYLKHALRAARGNVSLAARSVRKERRDFGRLLKKHRIDPRTF